jgi:multidrug efflux system outer membrane protein
MSWQIVLLLFFSACSLAPKHVTPPSPVPGVLPPASGAGVTRASDAIIPQVEDFYRSGPLRELIRSALVHNRDLRIALLNVSELRARHQLQRSRLYPEVSASGGLNRRRIPPNAFFNPGGGAGGVGGQAQEGFILKQYSLEVGITNYELDLFGRVRSLNEAALQSYFASAEAARTARVILISEVATAYHRLLATRELAELSRMTMASQEESLKLIRERQRAGVASELEYRQAETLFEAARADATEFSRLLELERHGLAVLIGRPLKEEETGEDWSAALNGLSSLAVGLSSEVLLQRPDIRRSEALLRAANADIGAARAAFFPSLSLSTGAGKLSTDLSTLFDRQSDTWLFFPQVTVPIFTGGRNRAQLEVAELRRDRRIAEYERSIQQAFRDVSDALRSHELLTDQLEVQRRIVSASGRALALGKLRYQSGVDNYLVELDAQRSHYLARGNYLRQQLAFVTNLSFLYRSLGGGSRVEKAGVAEAASLR